MRLRNFGCMAPLAGAALALTASTFLPGCGSESAAQRFASELVTRAAGGTVSIDGSASITIPPNSLAADTFITVQQGGAEPIPPAGMEVIGGTTFTFRPEGTTFSPPATLAITYAPTALPSSVPATSLQIGKVVGGNWTMLGGTVDTETRTVSVPISGFSTYAILGTTASGSLNPGDFAGNWNGEWVNTTFGSRNNATMTITVNELSKTASITLRIFGNVLGQFNSPAPETYNGAWTDSGFTINANSAIFGVATLTVTPGGQITGTADTNDNPNVSRVELTGNINSTTMNTTYTVRFRDTTSATGTLTFTKSGG